LEGEKNPPEVFTDPPLKNPGERKGEKKRADEERGTRGRGTKKKKK